MYVAKELGVLGIVGGFTMSLGIATLKNAVEMLKNYIQEDASASELHIGCLDK